MDERMSWPVHRFRAMGSDMAVWLDAAEATARPLLTGAETTIARAERVLSRFDNQSELSRLNARPGQWTPVSMLLWDVVIKALALAKSTGGLFDPTLLAALEAAGYTRSFSELERVAPPQSGRSKPGRWQEVELDPTRRAIRLPPRVRLDLGGIGKGHTAQRVMDWLASWGPCLVDAGGDLTAGAAPRGMPGWPVAVAAPAPAGATASDLFHLWLAGATLATSGIDYRRWQQNGQSMHHLIDPRSGRPAATDALTVTVLAPDAVRAEGWATAALVAGRDEGLALLEKQELAAGVVDDAHHLWLTPAMTAHVVWPNISKKEAYGTLSGSR
jgi:thiamine biosynthesis lipoprotein